jgi:hypothetical protein
MLILRDAEREGLYEYAQKKEDCEMKAPLSLLKPDALRL